MIGTNICQLVRVSCRARYLPMLPEAQHQVRLLAAARHSSTNTDFRASEELAKERYDVRVNEDMDKKRARLLYQSRKRGMLENGVILASFADKHLINFDAEQLDQYDRLINLPTNDWDIFYWATRTKPTPPEFETPVMAKLREHLKSKVSNQSVLGKTDLDDIVMPVVKEQYDLDVDVSEVDLINYKQQLFDTRTRRFPNGDTIQYMTEWRKRYFEKRLKRVISSPTSAKTLSDDREARIYSQKIPSRNELATAISEPKNLIDSDNEKVLKHHDVLQHILTSQLTNDPRDYDDETEAWCDMLWHRDYGRDDDRISPSRHLNCQSCQSRIHCCDPGLVGYVPREIFISIGANDRLKPSEILCQRCNFSEAYGAKLSHSLPHQAYEDFLRELGRNDSCIVCLLVDLTDFPGSIWTGFSDLIGSEARTIVVGNKLDLLPYDGHRMIERITYCLRKNINKLRPGNRNLRIGDVMVLSARTGFGVPGLVTRLLSLSETTKDIYIVGCDNTGKSTLFSALLQSNLSELRKPDLLSRVSRYKAPTTRTEMLRFPIYRAEEWEVQMAKWRTLRNERDTDAREKSLGHTTQRRQSSMPHMSTLINRLDYPRNRNKKEDVACEPSEKQITSEVRLQLGSDHPLSLHETTVNYLAADGSEFPDCGFVHHTPSCCHSDQIHDILTMEERLEVFPNETIMPRKYSLRPLQTIFIGGLGRVDLLTSQSNVIINVFASRYLPIHVLPTRKADQFYKSFLGSPFLGVPFGGATRLAAWPGLKQADEDFVIRGMGFNAGSVDVVLSSIGWAMVNLEKDQDCIIRAHSLDGRGIYRREPPLLIKANRPLGKKLRDTPVFKHPHFVTETNTELELLAKDLTQTSERTSVN